MIGNSLIYALAGVAVTCLALYHLLVQSDLFRRTLAANVMGTGIFLVLVALARRAPDGPPDPVPQAMVLTGIVVAISATALLLTLVSRLLSGELPAPEGPEEDSEPEGGA
jgi:multicomponent Na+:H+ antiporter subunit C